MGCPTHLQRCLLCVPVPEAHAVNMGLSTLGQKHLFLYNSVQTVGWTLVLAALIKSWVAHEGDTSYSYRDAGQWTRMFQAASILEAVHAAIGLVPSNPAMALLQWVGRSNVLFLVVDKLPQVQSSPAVAAMLFVWAVSEVIRYPWYALAILNSCPRWLTWLRYTAFIPLYPVGVVTEMMALYQALPSLQASNWYSFSLPNAWNMSFSYAAFVKVGLVLYVPLWWSLYSSLLRQRHRKLAAGTRDKQKDL